MDLPRALPDGTWAAAIWLETCSSDNSGVGSTIACFRDRPLQILSRAEFFVSYLAMQGIEDFP